MSTIATAGGNSLLLTGNATGPVIVILNSQSGRTSVTESGLPVTINGSSTTLNQVSASGMTGVGVDVTGTTNDDQLIGGSANDTLRGADGNDTLTGADGADRLIGGFGDNTLYTGSGADIVVAGNYITSSSFLKTTAVDTVMDFDVKQDRIDVSAWGISSFEALKYIMTATVNNQGSSLKFISDSDAQYIILTNTQPNNITSANFIFDNDPAGLTISGGNNSDYLFGTLYADQINGGGDDDQLFGDSGNDRLSGGSGANTIYGGAGADTIVAGYYASSSNFLRTTAIDTLIDFNVSEDRIDVSAWGISSFDALKVIAASTSDNLGITLTYILDDDQHQIVLPTVRLEQLQSTNFIFATTANATNSSGDANIDYLFGSLLGDTLKGGADTDVLYGDAGDDQLTGGAGSDTIFGGSGTDIAFFSGAYSEYTVTTEGTRTTVVHNNRGTDGTDILTGVEKLQFLDQAVAVAVTRDQARQMLLNGNAVDPTPATGGFGLQWSLAGTGAGDVIIGTSGNDLINSLEGNDAVQAGDGADIIDGGRGSNFLSGNSGGDRFFVDGRGASGAAGTSVWSTITDFSKAATENVTVWGWVAGTSRVLVTDPNGGADGFKGATWHMDLNGDGSIDASVTLTGLTNADVVQQIGIVETNGYFQLASVG
ncbi:hypothetical protein GE253_22450 [Niveispirillum sp. SYP-B3756]|uniref:beta strand repeat-containing protein n=1 Tax=Niveispirillum sp. SYP-B3756 TaxID=2662178 RepID=UPI001290DC9D|nr:hypothetical protein [Niveispirillum sp. SYP-B3756]MQP68082.1 hypothetical protein [Niveispirillum sp. SYP-B3756]